MRLMNGASASSGGKKRLMNSKNFEQSYSEAEARLDAEHRAQVMTDKIRKANEETQKHLQEYQNTQSGFSLPSIMNNVRGFFGGEQVAPPEIVGASPEYKNYQENFKNAGSQLGDMAKSLPKAAWDFGKEAGMGALKTGARFLEASNAQYIPEAQRPEAVQGGVDAMLGVGKNIGEIGSGAARLVARGLPYTLPNPTWFNPEVRNAYSEWIDKNKILNYHPTYDNPAQQDAAKATEAATFFAPITRFGKGAEIIEGGLKLIPKLKGLGTVAKIGAEGALDAVDVAALDILRGKSKEDVMADMKVGFAGGAALRGLGGAGSALIQNAKLTSAAKGLETDLGRALTKEETSLFKSKVKEGEPIEVLRDYFKEKDITTEATKLQEATGMKGLDKVDTEIEKKSFEYALKNKDKIIEDYKVKNGNVLNVDDMREAFRETGYKGTNAQAVHEPASYLIEALRKDMIAEVNKKGTGSYLIMGGGAGSGKTTALENIPNLKQMLKNSDMVLDGTIANYEGTIKKIQDAVDNNMYTTVAFVLRDTEDAFANGVLARLRTKDRIVPAEEAIVGHVNARKTLLKLYEKYGNDDRISFVVIDNNRGLGKAKAIPAEQVLDKIRKELYDTKGVKKITNKVYEDLEKAYEAGDITKEAYKKTKGNYGNSEEAFAAISKRIGTIPERGGKQVKIKERVKEKAKTVEKVVIGKKKIKTSNPVGSEVVKSKGEKVKSGMFERVKSQLDEAYQGDFSYNKLNLEKDAEQAVKLVETDPQLAYKIASGMENAPAGQTETAISIALAEQARATGNLKLQAELVTSRVMRQIRRGQEIVAEKGSVSENSVEHFMKKLIDERLQNINLGFVDNLRASKKGGKIMTGKKKLVMEKIDAETAKVRKQMKSKELDLNEAQGLINSLICKV